MLSTDPAVLRVRLAALRKLRIVYVLQAETYAVILKNIDADIRNLEGVLCGAEAEGECLVG